MIEQLLEVPLGVAAKDLIPCPVPTKIIEFPPRGTFVKETEPQLYTPECGINHDWKFDPRLRKGQREFKEAAKHLILLKHGKNGEFYGGYEPKTNLAQVISLDFLQKAGLLEIVAVKFGCDTDAFMEFIGFGSQDAFQLPAEYAVLKRKREGFREDVYADPGKESIDLYKRNMGKFPLLNKSQEQYIFICLESGVSLEILKNDRRFAALIEENGYQDREKFYNVFSESDTIEQFITNCNLRLVLSAAGKHVGKGLDYDELVQEGNIGLMRAIKSYEYAKDYKFSTYATWWIRQAIRRAIADKRRTIRIPVHVWEFIEIMDGVNAHLFQALGREPKPEETARELGVPVAKINEVIVVLQQPISLEKTIGEDGEDSLGSLVADSSSQSQEEACINNLLPERVREVLNSLDQRERRVLELRYGLDRGGRPRTLEEVGRLFDVTRERIRQIEAKAFRKFWHPSRRNMLKDFI